LLLPKSISETITEKEIYTTIRLQQYKFREMLINKLKSCPITHINDKRLLVASHIKPWCVSNDEEKLDIYNGFLFSPLYDKLFDRGLITFSKDKKMYISSTLSKNTVAKLNIKEDIYDELPIAGREKYLEFHNDKIFMI
ncbi:MAG: HNH endonuclease, partial [Candidatus Ornithomonoglobus sp.]